MRKLYITLIATTLFSTQPIFANETMSMHENKSCATIASHCLDAGYARGENGEKRFWQDCMKPLILGQAVKGVTVDANVIKECRAHKIVQLKKELSELQEAAKKN